MSGASVSAQVIRAFLKFFTAVEGPMAELLRRARISPEELERADGRISGNSAIALWTEGPAVLGDENFGLHVGQLLHAAGVELGPLDVLDYAVRTSATMRDAVQRLCRHAALLHEVLADLRVAAVGDTLHLRLLSPLGVRHAAEFGL